MVWISFYYVVALTIIIGILILITLWEDFYGSWLFSFHFGSRKTKVQELTWKKLASVSSFLLLLICQMETPVSSMKVAVHHEGPSGFRTACGLQECGLARFPFWVAHRWGRTAVDVLLSDCQYRKGTALYSQCGVWNTGDSWGGCGLSWAWTLLLVPVVSSFESTNNIKIIVSSVIQTPIQETKEYAAVVHDVSVRSPWPRTYRTLWNTDAETSSSKSLHLLQISLCQYRIDPHSQLHSSFLILFQCLSFVFLN